jgi:hypothetical protein
MLSIFMITLPNGDSGTGFVINWRQQRVIATCDHVFLGASRALVFRTQLLLSGNPTCCEVRRHPTADAAIIVPDTGITAPPLRILRAFNPPLPGSRAVFVTGFNAANGKLETYCGSERGQRWATKTFMHQTGNSKQYTGWLIGNSLPGVPGVSGAPVRTICEGGVIGLYSSSQQSPALTDAFHSAHLDQVP